MLHERQYWPELQTMERGLRVSGIAALDGPNIIVSRKNGHKTITPRCLETA